MINMIVKVDLKFNGSNYPLPVKCSGILTVLTLEWEIGWEGGVDRFLN